MENIHKRIWQVDALRGFAIFGMVLYHFLVDLEIIFLLPLGVYHMPLVLLARASASSFILLVGISAAFKFNRIKSLGSQKVFLGFAISSFKIMFWAMIITLVTYLLFPSQTIYFGILHFIALSLLLLIPFLYLPSNFLLVAIGILILGLGFVVPGLQTTNYFFIPFGLVPSQFTGFDYFPLIPWFGLVLFGLFIGRNYKLIYQILRLPKIYVPGQKAKFFVLLGRHSLQIYLLHQPILFTILLSIKKFFSL